MQNTGAGMLSLSPGATQHTGSPIIPVSALGSHPTAGQIWLVRGHICSCSCASCYSSYPAPWLSCLALPPDRRRRMQP